MISLYYFFIILVSLFVFTKQQLITVENYANMTGNQIYLFTTDPFVYISLYNNSTEALYGSFSLYFKSKLTNFKSTGFWIAVGFGENQMSGSDIIMCGILGDLKTTFCSDYESKGWNLILKDTQMIKLTGFSSNDNLDPKWSPYVSFMSFSFSRGIDPNRITGVLNIPKIINGNEKMVTAYGSMSGSTPRKHNNQLVGFITLDGSGINGQLISVDGINGVSKTKQKTLIPIKNLKKPFSQQKAYDLFLNLLTLILLILIIN